MVVGAGVAGMQAALDLANAGIKTYLIESQPTIAACSTGTAFGNRSCRSDAFATAMRIASFAFSVDPSWSCMCTHEFCSRIFAISNRNWFRPPSLVAVLNVGSWRRGEHAATTTPVSLLSLIALLITACPGIEHIYL